MDEKPLSEQQKLEVMRMFDKWCKEVIANAARDYDKKQRRISHYEIPASDPQEMYPASSSDIYFKRDTVFNVLGNEIIVKNRGLSESIKELPYLQREIILMYYFTSMTDEQISRRLKIHYKKVNRERHKAEKNLREKMR